jgi:hypothetical protein
MFYVKLAKKKDAKAIVAASKLLKAAYWILKEKCIMVKKQKQWLKER